MTATITARRTHTTYALAIEDEDGEEVELETSHDPDCNYEPLIEKLPGGGHVIGYLVQDDDPPDIFKDYDGEGLFFDRRRRHGASLEFYDYVDEKPRLGWICHPGYRGALYHHPHAVLLDVYDHGLETWALAGSMRSRMFPDQQWDVSHAAGVWVADSCALENVRCQVSQHLLQEDVASVSYESLNNPDGTCITRPWREGDPQVYQASGQVADERYFNRIVAKLRSGPSLRPVWKHKHQGVAPPEWVYLERGKLTAEFPKGYKTFDAAYRALFKFLGIKPDKVQKARAFRAALEAYCEGVIENLNACLHGDVWGVCVDTLDAEGNIVDDQACWGYIGSKHALESLADDVQCAVRHAIQKAQEMAS